MMSENLTMSQQADFNKWDIVFTDEMNSEDMAFGDLSEFYNQYVVPLKEKFSIDYNFSFLDDSAVDYLTPNQIISVIHLLNKQPLGNVERVTITNLKKKYRKSKALLGLSVLIENELQFREVEKLLSITHPIRLEEEIVDFDDYERIISIVDKDGDKCEIYFNPKNYYLIQRVWGYGDGSNWFHDLPFSEFLQMIRESDRPYRWIKSLKYMLKLMEED